RNALGEDEDRFFDDFARAVNGTRESPEREQLEDAVKDIQTSWKDWVGQRNLAAMRGGLEQLYQEGVRVRDSNSNLQPHGPSLEQMPTMSSPPADLIVPGENVAPLGRSLFTDYLLPVELGGTLLLVAVIGAIAIAGRRTEGLR